MDDWQFEHAEKSAREEVLRQLNKVRAEQAPRPEGFDGTCPTCGDDIPPLRINLGFYNCIYCQTTKEAQRRWFNV